MSLTFAKQEGLQADERSIRTAHFKQRHGQGDLTTIKVTIASPNESAQEEDHLDTIRA